jgi:hypothetical protein
VTEVTSFDTASGGMLGGDVSGVRLEGGRSAALLSEADLVKLLADDLGCTDVRQDWGHRRLLERLHAELIKRGQTQ